MTLEEGLTKTIAFERTNKSHSLTGLSYDEAGAHDQEGKGVGDRLIRGAAAASLSGLLILVVGVSVRLAGTASARAPR